MHTYAYANNGYLPAATINNERGQPLLSWRVALLPYLEEGKLYKKFHLDEAWDSSHNLALLKEMPRIYQRPRQSPAADQYTTIYQVFVGSGTIFAGPTPPSLVEITMARGTSQTLLVVEAGERVPWTKPADLVYDAAQPLPVLGGLQKDRGFRPFSREYSSSTFGAAFADAHVEPLALPAINESHVRSLIPWK